ncbi:hypothetical protein ASF10_10730 [Flavobacterium sp. Leaf82]|uniref:hypothetical protein n=1 Tax=unclassified Flavobacterium TaxID=196869 RepID=UPI00070169F5|nr:hypothetical protein [Flavobacterium sp. Leaf82]KQO22827.1 hypothetical protein ASF10_10730 [Flavobacterium sp. Leaf82]
MAILTFLKYSSILLMITSCNKYEEDTKIYDFIAIKNWETKIADNEKGLININIKSKLFYYEKNTNFKKLTKIDSIFEVTRELDSGTEKNPTKSYSLIITPKFENDKSINDDMILLLNDSIEYRFTNVCFIKDTVKRPTFIGYKFTIRYNLKATVNDKQINYADTLKSAHQSSYISLDATLGKRIK